MPGRGPGLSADEAMAVAIREVRASRVKRDDGEPHRSQGIHGHGRPSKVCEDLPGLPIRGNTNKGAQRAPQQP